MYWPMAIIDDKRNEPYTQFTYEGCVSIDDAKEVIEDRKSNDKQLVLLAYVTTDNHDEVVYIENNVDVYGTVHYQDGKIKKIGEKKN